MKHHEPYSHDAVDLIVEAEGLGVYLNLAQGLQVIGEIIDGGGECGTEDLLKVMSTFAHTLYWLDSTGFADRHPDLLDMPETVAALDFQGGEEGLTRWLVEEIANLANRESVKRLNYLN